jgi:hypothetical protein
MRRLLGILIVAVLSVAACGGGGDSEKTAADKAASSTTVKAGKTSKSGGGSTTTAAGGGGTATTKAAGGGGAGGGPAAPAGSGSDGHTSSQQQGGAAAQSSPTPASGRAVYSVDGFYQTGTGPTAKKEKMPPEATDDIKVTKNGDTTELRVVSTAGKRSSETVTQLTATEARITELKTTDNSGATPQSFTVHPQPPILIARFPYKVGDKWEQDWKDPALGLTGHNTGAILREENVTTSRGTTKAIVVENRQKLTGAVTGELVTTVWVDPADGVQLKRNSVSDINGPGGPTHAESTAVLKSGPS